MGRKHQKSQASQFERWTQRWTTKHPLEELPDAVRDPDFQDFLCAAYKYFNLTPQIHDGDACQIACVVYQMAMDYSEERARRDEPTGYRRTTKPAA